MRAFLLAAAILALALAPVLAQDGPPAPPNEVAEVDEADAAAGPDPLDRILAIVDEDPILDSDLDRVLALGLSQGDPGAGGEAQRRQVLDRLIEERLRFHEIDRFGFSEISLDEVDRGYEAIRSRFSSSDEFEARLAAVELDPEGLRQLVARQIMVLTYVEERLGSRVFVSLDEIRAYYNDVLEPEMKARGEAVPPLAEVREQIRSVLKQQRLNEEIERWTDELRLEADIEDFFDSPVEELPEHLLDTIEPE